MDIGIVTHLVRDFMEVGAINFVQNGAELR